MEKLKTPQQPTKVGGIRLEHEDWEKLRFIMQARGGRAWLEKIIRREYKSICAKDLPPNLHRNDVLSGTVQAAPA